MDTSTFDGLTQEISLYLSRRRLLQAGTLAAAGLGLGFSTTQQAAAKKGKRRKRSRQGDANALCKTQVADCETLLTTVCAGEPQCLTTVQTCCPAVGTCDLSGFLSCLLVNQV